MDREARLRALVRAEFAHPDLKGARLSLLVVPLGKCQPLISVQPNAHRVPASNAKLLTTTAAALALTGKALFSTRVYVWRDGGPIYLRGAGDPSLRRAHLAELTRTLKASGVTTVRGVVVDDSYMDRRRLAPGFEAFTEGVHYRPTSGALNLDGNAVKIRVSAPRNRRRPRVDVTPPSDYVRVRKRVRFSRARRGKAARQKKISIERTEVRGIMWLTISGTMGRRSRPLATRRAVYDPAFNAGWALRRALVAAGVTVKGSVRRGRIPRQARLVASRRGSLAVVIGRTNRNSDNLAAESLVRVMGIFRARNAERRARKGVPASWKEGLAEIKERLASLGVKEFWMGNGSGLHRTTWVTARAMVTLLQKVHGNKQLRALILPSLAVAGRSGTLTRRMRKTAAAAHVRAKTGTLNGVMALSGYAALKGKKPLAFSLLVNGKANRKVRNRMDRVAALLARYARGLPLEDPEPTKLP